MLAADASLIAPTVADPLDVNGDGLLLPIDVLEVVNHLTNDHSQNRLECDVNRDGQVSPADALLLVNELNRQTGNAHHQRR
jgi:hypothetical protein